MIRVPIEGPQPRSEMRSAQIHCAGGRQDPTSRRRPAFEHEAGAVRGDAPVLYREGAVGEQARTFRHVVDRYPALFMNVEAGPLRRLAGMAPIATLFAAALVILVLVRLLVHPARLHGRPTLLLLEHGSVVAQLPNGCGLLQHLFLQFRVPASWAWAASSAANAVMPVVLRPFNQRKALIPAALRGIAAAPTARPRHRHLAECNTVHPRGRRFTRL